jgi:hypothetical protein
MANMQRTLDLTYDEIVIGSDLSALCYSYIYNKPLIYLKHNKPSQFSMFDENIKEIDKWNEIMFFLSLSNLCPFSDNLQSIRLIDDHNLKVVTKENYICNISFNSLVISDDEGISGIGSTHKKTETKNLVIDWFKVISGRKHDYSILETDDDFVSKLEFYNSKRFFYFPEFKDIKVFSSLSDYQLLKSDYSEVMVKLKTIRMMKEANIKPDKYKKLRIEHEKREIHKLGKNIYSDLPSNIKMLYDTPQDIMKSERKENKYLNYIERAINGWRSKS